MDAGLFGFPPGYVDGARYYHTSTGRDCVLPDRDPLKIGEISVIDVVGAQNINLGLLTDDGAYELFCSFSYGALNGDINLLRPNNLPSIGSVVASYGIIDVNTPGTNNGFNTTDTYARLSTAGNLLSGRYYINTSKNQKYMLGDSIESTATIAYLNKIGFRWGDGSVWQSLGTVACSNAQTGRICVKRVG